MLILGYLLITRTVFAFECFEGADFTAEEIVELATDIVISKVTKAELIRRDDDYVPDDLSFDIEILETMLGDLEGELTFNYRYF
ncbi:MAG: hypothetical protein R3F50_17635 [Gammaproteobacteria bacterium]|jgi:hypothetical protein